LHPEMPPRFAFIYLPVICLDLLKQTDGASCAKGYEFEPPGPRGVNEPSGGAVTQV
jgi:hypothetical protein